ncbi:threonine aldolase family protein [Streptacidiphilus rugosus]|uniref:threonine aldolase family protein n=1 Tax=Streptacidiphilus rugosus TaxID=405783 RepID=UPI000564C856|nr:beta-eliminating lyase-related protein [Streptacidiphilus rugosus]
MADADETTTTDPVERRFLALRGCERQLSGVRPQSLAERLADLSGDAGRAAYDLDGRSDVYGDGIVAALEDRVAELLGTEAAAFFPTGTMAQQVALRCWAERTGNDLVAMHPLAHPEVHERHAYAQLSDLRSVWPTTAPRLPTASEVADCGEPFGTLMLELPLRDAGFVLPSWAELTATVQAARDRDAVVHFDGARLWETVRHFGVPLREIAELADSVYVSFYKTLGGVSGAALAGPTDFVAQAKAWRHRYGGQLFQQWPAALAALIGLDREIPRLDDYVVHAKQVALALATAPGSRVHPAVPQTHQFQFWLPFTAEALNEATLRQAEETKRALFGGWRDSPVPGLALTEITVADPALDWSPQEIADALTEFLSLLG